MLLLLICVSDEWRFWSGVLPKPPQPTSPAAPEPAEASNRAIPTEIARSTSPIAQNARSWSLETRVIERRSYSCGVGKDRSVDQPGGRIVRGALKGPYTSCMKWAVVTMCRSSVRSVRFSIATSNHACVLGSKHDTRHTAAPRSVPLPTTCAFETATQNGCGCFSGTVCDFCHVPPVCLSQRVAPITTAEEPCSIWYARRSGATTRQRVLTACRVSEAM